MGFFYDREETEKEIIIIHKKCAWYYMSLWSSVLCLWGWYFSEGRMGSLFMKLAAVLIILMVFFAISNWKVTSEVRKASKKGRATVSGNRYSLSNPRKYIITKRDEEK